MVSEHGFRVISVGGFRCGLGRRGITEIEEEGLLSAGLDVGQFDPDIPFVEEVVKTLDLIAGSDIQVHLHHLH